MKEGLEMNQSKKLLMLVTTALFAAIIGILAQIVIPLPLIPITGQTLAIGLAATILGSRYGTISTLLYIGMGAIGIPVFSQMTGGLGIVFGPTGGFIIGFIPAAFIIGYYIEKSSYTVTNACIANLIGMIITLTFGTAWLKISANLLWTTAFFSGFAPFVIVGILKAFLAGWVGILVRKRLIAANILINPSPHGFTR